MGQFPRQPSKWWVLLEMNSAAIGGRRTERLILRTVPTPTLSIMLACYTIVFLGSIGCGGGGSTSSGPVSPALTAITVTPAYSSIPLGSNLQFRAKGAYSDGTTKELTLSADWSSSNNHMASVNASGMATPLSTGGVTISAAFGGVSGSTLLAITPSDSARLVWFAPDDASADMLNLFSHPEQWPNARASVQVFKFYVAQLLAPPNTCGTCGQNTEPNLVDAGAFSKLNQWGLDIGIEIPVVKSWACTADLSSAFDIPTVQVVQSNGGVVSYLAMDEPFIGGQSVDSNGQSCNYSMQQSATQTAQFVKLMHTFSPTVQIGDIEPYPYFSESQLESWITTLQADGVNLAFFHLDVNSFAAGANLNSDLQLLDSFCHSHGIPFGVIFIDQQLDTTQELSDQDYYTNTMQWVQTVKSAIGVPQHLIFQSWILNGDGVLDVPMNLPENDPAIYIHTRRINDGRALLSK